MWLLLGIVLVAVVCTAREIVKSWKPVAPSSAVVMRARVIDHLNEIDREDSLLIASTGRQLSSIKLDVSGEAIPGLASKAA